MGGRAGVGSEASRRRRWLCERALAHRARQARPVEEGAGTELCSILSACQPVSGPAHPAPHACQRRLASKPQPSAPTWAEPSALSSLLIKSSAFATTSGDDSRGPPPAAGSCCWDEEAAAENGESEESSFLFPLSEPPPPAGTSCWEAPCCCCGCCCCWPPAGTPEGVEGPAAAAAETNSATET